MTPLRPLGAYGNYPREYQT